MLYKDLVSSQRQIRLLHIHPLEPGQDEGLVHCTMETSSLQNTDLIFHARSYAWSELPGREELLVNGEIIYVTNNLVQALLEFRRAALTASLWVDAICINQNNVAERSQQVALMKDVYSLAANVHIWLGPAFTESPDPFRTLRRLSDDGFTELTIQRYYNVDGDGRFELYLIMSRTYWSRLWVLQEAALSLSNAIVRCGPSSIPLKTVMKSFFQISKASYAKQIAELLRPVNHSILRIDNARVVISTFDPQSLGELVLHAASTNVALDHDRLYGLLGVCPPTLDMKIDYDLPIHEVYQSAVTGLFEHFGNLELLVLASGASQPLDGEGCASWCIDFAAPTEFWSWRWMTPRLIPDLKPFEADLRSARRRTTLATYHTEFGGLFVQALQLSCVDWVAPSTATIHAEGVKGGPLPGNRTALRQWRAEYCTRQDEFALQNDAHSFWRTATGGLVNRVPSYFRWSEHDLSIAKSYDEWLYGENEDPGNIVDVAQDGIGSDFFCTENGMSGVIGARMQVRCGDVVTISNGLSVPCLLRPSCVEQTNTYRFVGACYVDGMMDGEAVQRALRLESRGTDTQETVIDVFHEIVLV